MFQWAKILAWLYFPTGGRKILFLLVIDIQANASDIKSHFACTLFHKMHWCGCYTVLMCEGSTIGPTAFVSWKMRITHRQFTGTISKDICCSQLDEEWGRLKRNSRVKASSVLGSRQLPGSQTLWLKKRSHVAVSALIDWALCPGLASELKWGLASLFYCFSMPQTVSLFL